MSYMLNFIYRCLFVICLLTNFAHADDSPHFQIGTMYAEKIRGVGLYAGFEAEEILPNASGYIDATLLISDAYDAEQPVFGGVSIGLRTALDVPLSPYVGAGLYVGENEKEVSASHDKIDNDRNGFIDETWETTTDNQLMTAIYPEVGFRLQVAETFSIRMMGRYMVSSFGRSHDDWFYGLSFAFGHD
jgi:hypothetical protein